MLGIVSAGITAYYIMKRDGRGWHVHIFDFTMYCGLSGIVGGRLWDVFFFDWAYYHNHLTEIPYVWQGGMAIQGGLLFGAVAGILYTKYHHIDTWAFADLLAPSIILGQSIGRMANLMNGDAFGHPTGGDFGIVYPDTTLAYHTYGNQPCGRPKSGKVRSTSWSSSRCSSTAASPTRRARYFACTSCSTPSNASSWNSSVATTST